MSTRGKKGRRHDDPADPPRRRANRYKGLGTWDHDRPPVLGVVSRQPGKPLYLRVVTTTAQAVLLPPVVAVTLPGSIIYSDECLAYRHLPEHGRGHGAVCHSAIPREFARDDDRDGVREVHCNTLEGLWTGLRNFLRPFRGVHKGYLAHYIAVFQAGHHHPTVNATFIQTLLRRPPPTTEGT